MSKSEADRSNQSSDPYLGTTVKNRYLIERELGRGGLGVVYLARDQQLLGKPIVIKVLLEHSLEDGWAKRKFLHELEALNRIDHPNIVGLLDAGELPDGKPYFVMQFVEGVTLRSVISAEGLELPLIGYLIRQIGQALSAAHEKGVYHRDLKPANIMLQTISDTEMQIKLIDFGLARVENSQLAANTIAPIIAGTLLYMSPEQLNSKSVGAASDIFSMGVIAYQMVTGQLPFKANSIYQLIDLQRAGVSVPPIELRPNLPAAAQAAILKALSFDPELRYPRARDFGEELALSLISDDQNYQSTPMEISENQLAAQLDLSTSTSGMLRKLEPIGGAVPLDSKFYLERDTDQQFLNAIARHENVILVKGARQMGKTSLLARGLQQARKSGDKVLLTDFQKLNTSHLETPDSLFLMLGELISDQLDLAIYPDEIWRSNCKATQNFEAYWRAVLAQVPEQIIWGMDEVDRLFSCNFCDDVFSLFHSWCNECQRFPDSPWRRLMMVISYATEANLFISNVNQSPFGVAVELWLPDFTLDQVADLNQRYHSPLLEQSEIERFYQLVGGHPYLVRRGLYEMATRRIGIAQFEKLATRDDGPYGEHLYRMLILLAKDPSLRAALREVVQLKGSPDEESFYRLRNAGVVLGDSAKEARPRYQLYSNYLKHHLH